MSKWQRKANSFPDMNVPGDPRLLGAIERRTPRIAGGTGSINHYFGSTVITPKKSARGGAKAGIGELVPTTTKPAWLAGSETEPGENTLRVWLTYGTINNRVATNFDDHFDITTKKKIWAKATFKNTGPFALESWEIKVEPEEYEPPEPEGSRPDEGWYLLGQTIENEETLHLVSSGSGSLQVWPQISNTVSGDEADSIIIWNR